MQQQIQRHANRAASDGAHQAALDAYAAEMAAWARQDREAALRLSVETRRRQHAVDAIDAVLERNAA